MEIIFSNASPKPIYEQITSQIKAMIMNGELKAGDPMPSMRKLAKELHVSVITTQRAYEDLQKFIEIETNDEEISKWAAILLFANKAYEESSRAIGKISNVDSSSELREIKELICLFEGKFESAGVEGRVI